MGVKDLGHSLFGDFGDFLFYAFYAVPFPGKTGKKKKKTIRKTCSMTPLVTSSY